MAILKIAQMGHPILARRADPVANPDAAEIKSLIRHMRETLDDAGGVGLAAPQVHVPLRVLIFEAPATRIGPDEAESAAEPRRVLINPELDVVGDDMEIGWEGCLSVEGLRGAVPRYTHIRYRGLSDDGEMIEREAHGFHARVFQHEFDHLDGILYPMRMTDLSTLHFVSEMRFHPGAMGPDPNTDAKGEDD